MKGKWISVHCTDGFSMLPVYQCSVCKSTTSGYYPDKFCVQCGAENEVDSSLFVELSLGEIFGYKERE